MKNNSVIHNSTYDALAVRVVSARVVGPCTCTGGIDVATIIRNAVKMMGLLTAKIKGYIFYNFLNKIITKKMRPLIENINAYYGGTYL